MRLILYGITFILAGIIMLIITLVQWLKLLSFRNCAVTTAAVTDVKQSTHYSNSRRRVSYTMRVSYSVDGIAYERDLPCGADDYNLGANREVEILYKDRNPRRILLHTPDASRRGQRILWIVTLALLVIGGVLVLLGR